MIAVGIDIPKAKSTVAVIDSDGTVLASPFTMAHTQPEMEAFVTYLKGLGEPTTILMEYTGHYHLLSRVYHISQRKNILIRKPDRFTAYRTPICKKPHARHLDGANMGLEVSLAYSGTRNRSWQAAAVSSLESCFMNARLRENRFFILPR